jgi:hypothetical protein
MAASRQAFLAKVAFPAEASAKADTRTVPGAYGKNRNRKIALLFLKKP